MSPIQPLASLIRAVLAAIFCVCLTICVVHEAAADEEHHDKTTCELCLATESLHTLVESEAQSIAPPPGYFVELAFREDSSLPSPHVLRAALPRAPPAARLP